MKSGTYSITLIAPVAPFRGGIAQHSTMLANAMSERVEINIVSFSRLYPRWLYPGKSQTESGALESRASTRFLLDAINPVSWLRVAREVEKQPPSLVIIPWWTFFLAPCFGWIARRFRRAGIPVLFFCHNVVDHETAGWKKFIARLVLKQGVFFAVQARDERAKLRALLGDVPVFYHPLPLFDQFPATRTPLPRRATLELLFYGFIRPYKGLDVLIEAMKQLKGSSVHLSIVGEPWGDDENVWRRRIADADVEELVEFVPRYVSDEETTEYFARADAVVLPYRSATGTAVVAAAYHYRKPVIASSVGGLRDVVFEGETGLLVPSENASALAKAIQKFSRTGIPGVKENIEKAVTQMTWPHLAESLLHFVREPGTSQGPRK